jgi:hypothetical protein
MFILFRRHFWVLGLGLLGLLLAPAPASAQWYGGARGPYGRAGYLPARYWGNTYVSTADPYGGYLNGGANVINAQGGYLKDVQDAYLKKEHVKAAKLANKRAAFDEWRYEKANTPSLEEQRENIRVQNVLRSRNNPPATEIWSGKALNDLLQDLQQSGARGGFGSPMYLNQDLLKEINVTVGTTTTGLGILKNGGKFRWPLALIDDRYEPSRKRSRTCPPPRLSKRSPAASIRRLSKT